MQSPRTELEHFRVLLNYRGRLDCLKSRFGATSGAAQVFRAIFSSRALIV